MIEKLLAIGILVVCIGMLVRLGIGAQRRSRWDGAACQAWRRVRSGTIRLWNWRTSRRQAAIVAEEAIRRARKGMERDGNVYRPDAFREPRKPH